MNMKIALMSRIISRLGLSGSVWAYAVELLPLLAVTAAVYLIVSILRNKLRGVRVRPLRKLATLAFVCYCAGLAGLVLVPLNFWYSMEAWILGGVWPPSWVRILGTGAFNFVPTFVKVLTGQVTSANGRQSTDLAVSAPNARLLWNSGMLSDLSVSLGWHYWFDGEMPTFGAGGFAEETRSAWIRQQPELVALNGLSAAPAFYYGDPPQVEWLEGWDESFLRGSDYYSILDCMSYWQGYPVSYSGASEWLTYPCLVSQGFLEERGLELGDTFEMQVRMEIRDQDHDLVLSFQIVGAYSGSASQREIYVPLSFWCDPSWITGEEAPVADGERITSSSSFSDKAGRDAYFYISTNFSTCRFTLASPRQLDDLRDYLEGQGFSQVGSLARNRTTVVLQDQSFVETVGGLGRYVTFSQILLPVLCAAVGLLGFVISWLMVNGRRMEFAIMRGLGASRGRVFCSFFLEQGALALLGCILGGLVLTIAGAGWAGWLAATGFLVCYLIGCALAVLAVGRTQLMSLLSERE